jgi:hypothetical protein
MATRRHEEGLPSRRADEAVDAVGRRRQAVAAAMSAASIPSRL